MPRTPEQDRDYQRNRYQTNEKRQQQVAAQSAKWAAENPEKRRESCRKWREKNGKAYKLKRYGMTVEQYDEMLTKQEGKCAICSEPPSENNELVIDHDHATGKVRGLLHRKCNRHLGIVEQDGFGEKALTYLRRSK